MGDKLLTWLRNSTVGALALALLAALLLPIYSDEIGWRFQERAGFDGVDKLFSDICGPNTLAAPPIFMMPVRWFSALLNGWFADPFWVRVSGILYALLWVALLLALIARLARDIRERLVLSLLAVGLIGLANTPLLLVWSRPEQPILLAVTGAMLLAFPAEREGQDVAANWRRSLVIFVLATIALSYHLKALLLVPVFLVCLFFCCRGRDAVWPRLVAAILLAVVAAMSAQYWVERLQCPDDPILNAMFEKTNSGARLSEIGGLSGLPSFLGEIAWNMSFWDYVKLALPVTEPMSSWLPEGQISAAATDKWKYLLYYCWGGVAILAIYAVWKAGRAAIRDRRLEPRIILAILLVGIVLAWSATQTARNVYEAVLVLPLTMLAMILALSAARLGERATTLRNVLGAFMGLAAILSMAAIAWLWSPSLQRANAQTGYIPGQPYSIPTFGYSALEPDIHAAARLCGIPEPGEARGLLVDEVTYFAFMQSRLPQHRLGVLEVWNGSITDPVAYLKSRGSDGIIVGCHLLPDDLRARAKASGKFCCLGPKEW